MLDIISVCTLQFVLHTRHRRAELDIADPRLRIVRLKWRSRQNVDLWPYVPPKTPLEAQHHDPVTTA